MKKLLVVLACLLLLVGCGSENSAKEDDKIRIGILQIENFEALNQASQGFMDVLEEEFGKDGIDFDLQYADGDSNNCLVIANGFVAEGYDLILANATPSLIACKNATKDIPILGTAVTEYGVALNLTDYDGTVGGNVSGTSDLAPLDGQAQMIVELFPDVKKVGLMFCNAEPNSKYQVEEVGKFLKELGVESKQFSFSGPNDIQLAIDSAKGECDVLYVPTDNTCAANGKYFKNADMPVITGEEGTCKSCGGVATLSINYYDLGRTTGEMAVRVLNGEDISKMPIEYFKNPVKEFNKEMAEKFNVAIPSEYVEIVIPDNPE